MILFCVDQVAGAEYLLPLLRRWLQQGRMNWHVCAGPRSIALLQSHQIPFTALGDDLPSETSRIIAELRPRLALMSSSADSAIEIEFRKVLRQAGVRCVQFIDMWVNYAVRFRDSLGHSDYPDLFLTLDDCAKQAMVNEGLPLERIVVIGQPYFEARLQELASQVSATPVAGKTLLVTQPISRYLGKRLGYDEIDFLEGTLRAWKQVGADWTRLHVIVHPDEDRQTYCERLASYDPPIQIVDNRNLKLSDYSLVISMYSSLMIQSMLANVNTVSFQPSASGPDICHLSAQGLVKRITNVEELVHFLAKMSADGQHIVHPQLANLTAAIRGSCDRLEQFLLA